MGRQYWWFVALLASGVAASDMASTRVIQVAPASDWRQMQSYGLRLSVAPSAAITTPITATFAIQGPGTDGLQSRTDRQLEPGRFTHVFFPDEFGRKPLPGRYLWTCRVGDKIVAQGEFVYPSSQER